MTLQELIDIFDLSVKKGFQADDTIFFYIEEIQSFNIQPRGYGNTLEEAKKSFIDILNTNEWYLVHYADIPSKKITITYK